MSAAPDPAHFARAVTQLGEQRRVVARTPIFNSQGLKIIDKGVAIDSRLYERLSQHQLKAPLADCLDSDPGVSGEALREAARLLLGQEPLFANMLAEPRLRDMLLDELALMPLPGPVAFQLTLMRETLPNAWLHALGSMLTAGWLAARQGGTRYDLRLLACAGLVHDIGMLHVDPVLQQPEIALSAEQRRHLYTHPLVSVMMLERHHEYPRELLRAVLEHHETLDGSGYPRRIEGDALSPWGRVLSLTEVVTAMFAPERPLPSQRLSLVLRMNRQRYDAALVREVLQVLQKLPALPAPAALAPGADPLQALAALERALRAWPAEGAPERAALDADHRSAAADVQDRCAQVLRNLAGTGASAAQLAQLGAEELDEALRAELALIVREGAWQLRSVVRQARRRFDPGAALPAWLAGWLDDADALCAQHLSAAPASASVPT